MYLIFGASGGLGLALAQHASARGDTVVAVSRSGRPEAFTGEWIQVQGYEPEHMQPVLQAIEGQTLTGVISALGILHTNNFMPEKRIEDLSAEALEQTYYVNAVLPMLLLQALKSKLPTNSPCVWVQLSAKVGSITDNYLGGWYSYRASKAALNMLLKTAAIELKRTHKQLTIAAIHPGTTDTELSKPFQRRLPADKLYTPELSAERIWQVIENLEPEQSGQLFHWDGKQLPY
ncbi:short-chain dehydrogenase [Pseudidiomarina aestuarii]|uniref:Short-chain dehydrogenase n=1 Tax=Pseudidiomarina aestuarii TaxID=624146 RepID=A0A7Z7ESP4_9GAMM|nr:SDR family NAD(P)-dependent oxidoreductase [Pseudidiomarina aestuarii]RUO39012.1 short-chain dehydrogenase [Pseudidiomarina aestuarii]